MFSSKLLRLTKYPSPLTTTSRFSSNYRMKEPVDKCVSHFQGVKKSCFKKEASGCRMANPSIKCVSISPERICEKIEAPKKCFRDMLLAAKQHIHRECINECCCLANFVHYSKISLNDVVRHWKSDCIKFLNRWPFPNPFVLFCWNFESSCGICLCFSCFRL